MSFTEAQKRILCKAKEKFTDLSHDVDSARDIILRAASDKFNSDGPFEKSIWTMNKLTDGLLVVRNVPTTEDARKISYMINTETWVAVRLERDEYDFVLMNTGGSCDEYFTLAERRGSEQKADLFHT